MGTEKADDESESCRKENKTKQDGDFKHQVMSSKPHCILETSFMKSGKTTKVRRENFSVK